jgi:hypothetical protein
MPGSAPAKYCGSVGERSRGSVVQDMDDSRGRVGAARRAATFGVAALLVGPVVFGACGGSSSRSADDVLASAQAFVADASSFTFDVHSRTTYLAEAGDPGEGGWWEDSSLEERERSSRPARTSDTERASTKGAWTAEGWESRTNWHYGRREEKVFGTTGYYRDGTGGDPGRWGMYEIPRLSHETLVDDLQHMVDDPEEYDVYLEAPGASVSLATSVYLGGLVWGGIDMFDDPPGFVRGIADMSDPEVASEDDASVTLVAELTAPADIEVAWGEPLPSGRVTLTVGLDGAPESLDLLVAAGGDSIEVEIDFADWNTPVEITRPADDEVDPTPWLDEESVAAVPGIQLLRPTALPEGWELISVLAYAAGDSPEACDQVELYWSPPLTAGAMEEEVPDDYFDVYLLPVDCALASDPTPFDVGPYAPLASRQTDYGTEVLVGDTVVQIQTSLVGRGLASVVVSLAPTDLATLSAEMAWSSSHLLTS